MSPPARRWLRPLRRPARLGRIPEPCGRSGEVCFEREAVNRGLNDLVALRMSEAGIVAAVILKTRTRLQQAFHDPPTEL